MTDITREMILDYMVRKGGVVKNVDLVRHFRKHLQLNDPFLKGALHVTGPRLLVCVHVCLCPLPRRGTKLVMSGETPG